MNSRLNAKEIRQYVTPFVMRYLLTRLTQGKDIVTHNELLQAGISELSIQALIQTRRIALKPEETTAGPDEMNSQYQILIQN